MVLAIGYTTLLKAENTSVTPKQFGESVASIPGKVGNHITKEWDDMKEYQTKSYTGIKRKWASIKSKAKNVLKNID